MAISAKRGSKWTKKRSKIEAEIEDEKRSSWGRLGSRFGVVLVPILGSKIIKLIGFYMLSRKFKLKSTHKGWRRILGRFWIDLVPQMEPKWGPKWSQNGTKNQSKTCQDF